MAKRQSSALIFVLKGLIPYSRENIALSFSPNRFFNELERQSGYRRRTLEEAARRGQTRGLIQRRDKILSLTESGLNVIQPYAAQQIENGKLMVIFDIPNEQSASRQTFRRLLRYWGFEMVQRSVWLSDKDHRQSVNQAVKEMNLGEYVEVYEVARIG